VQTTHKIEGSSAVRFARYLLAEASRGDYYTHDGQGGKSAPTQWHGPEQLLRRFGIDPEKAVEMKHLGPLMQGFDPVTEKPIRPAGSNGTRVAGIDLSYAPPKEVSALWATTDPYRRAQIEVAHRKAVASTLERIEREVALVRRKTDGVQRFEKAKGLLATEVVHTTSRLGKGQDEHGIPDPQLHSHIVLLAAERKDGVLAAIESKQLYRSARENGAWYRSELAANLQELGIGIERHQGNGERYFGVRGVSKELSERWSSRTEDVHRAANLFRQRYGREPGPGELDSFTLSTRGSKTAAGTEEVNAAWRALGEEHNQTAQRSEEAFHDWGLHTKPVDLRKELLAAVTRERSMITTHELQAKAYELSAGVCRPAEADRLVNDLERSGELLRLEGDLWTTQTHRDLEQATLDIATERATENTAPVSDQARKQARREIGRELHGSLTQEQRDAVETITGQGGVTVLVGQAGTGKGVVIATAARAWQLEGNEVIGTAIAGATAKRLQADANLDRSLTTDSLLNGIENGHIRLDRNTVVVMDEAGMTDSDRLARLVKLTAERDSKLVLAGDAAQLSSIGAGGLFKEIEGKAPTAELSEVHRAQHEWERKAWAQIRAGEPGPALAQYQANDRLHIYDTRAQAAEAMIANWDETRRSFQNGQAVMITDASNKERDQMNAMAQDRRAQASELGAHRVTLPDKPYELASGDEIIFTAQHQIPGQDRVENGTTGTIINASRRENRVTIKTREREPRDVHLDTSKFADISLAYAVHVYKGQGLTAETSGILTGGWQTDKEHTYVAVSRAREQTQIYVSREDLGETGLDTGAIERLAERMQQSRAQQASVTKEIADRDGRDQRVSTRFDTHRVTQQDQRRKQIEDNYPLPRHRFDLARDRDQPDQPGKERAESTAAESASQTHPGNGPAPIDIRAANPEDVQITERDLGDTHVAYSQVYDLQGYTGEQTYVLFGAWQTDKEQGFVAATGGPNGPETHSSSEQRSDRDIAAELKDRIEQVIERSQTQEPPTPHETSTTNETGTPDTEADREPQPDHPPQLEPGEPHIDQAQNAACETNPEQAENAARDVAPEQVDRDPYIEQAIQDARDRQQAWEQGINPDRDNDRGFGIE
jgi:conjugative relaxase-like TrwC/TraI family protein